MKVRWTRPALADLDEIQEFIARDSPAAAHRLVNRVIDQTELLLARNPRAGRRGRIEGTRELVLSGTSYIVAYRVRSNVEVLAVIHGARDWPEEFEQDVE